MRQHRIWKGRWHTNEAGGDIPQSSQANVLYKAVQHTRDVHGAHVARVCGGLHVTDRLLQAIHAALLQQLADYLVCHLQEP